MVELLLTGEPLAVDLANTVKTVGTPTQELLVDDDGNAEFWELQADRLPEGATAPSRVETLRLREAVRSVLLSRLESSPFDPAAVKALNGYAAMAPSFPQLTVTDGAERRTAWASASGADLSLAAVAGSAMEVVTGPAADRLRTCGSDKCSMLFVATNAKRRWCSSEVCGNRERVARHARQRREIES